MSGYLERPLPSPPASVRRGIPRPFEAVVALLGLLTSAPLVALAAAFVVVTSGRPAFFRQERVGRGGRIFWIYKLRTMRPSSRGLELTGTDDPRITRFGMFLRRTKIDELPQLWNVIKGEMSLVGPRPEVPRYVDPHDPIWGEVLRVRPGITDPVSIRLRDEESLLARAGGDRERFYREQLQPLKLDGYVTYIRQRNWLTDLRILGKTLMAVFGTLSSQTGSVSGTELRVSGLHGAGSSDKLPPSKRFQ